MSEDRGASHDEHKREHRAEHQTAQPGPGQESLQAPGFAPSYYNSLLGDPRLNGRGNGPVKAAVMRQAQQTYGNRAVQRFLQRCDSVNLFKATDTSLLTSVQRQRRGSGERRPQIESQRQGQIIRYRPRPGSWSVGWVDIHARVAQIADLAPFMQAFSVADLRRGSTVSRSVTLPNGSTARVDLTSRRAAGREGQTRQVGPGHVSVVFNRGAELAVALGLAPGAEITASAVASANADPAHLQRALDNQVFEVFVHELTHALLLLERGLPASAVHSTVFNDRQAMQAASERGAAANAAREVDLELNLLIRDLVMANVSEATSAQVIATLRADPDLAPARVRQWFLDERMARSASDRAASTNTGNDELAGSYTESLRQTIRAKIGRIAHLSTTRSGGSEAFSRRVQVWLDATNANLRRQAVPPATTMHPTQGNVPAPTPQR